MGLELLKTLMRHPSVRYLIVLTRYNPKSVDCWENAVYEYSMEQNYETIIENTCSFEEIRACIIDKNIDLTITHAYMKILPEWIFNLPPLGSINIHASLLPKYRGASPAYWVLKNREKESGLTCHYIDQGVDTGDIIHQVKFTIEHDDTVSSIIEKGKRHIPELMDHVLHMIKNPDFIPEKQDENQASYAPKNEELL